MIRTFSQSLYFLAILFLFSSCATIVGGTNYYARVKVTNVDGAAIYYKGMKRGIDEASFKAPRREANKFSVTLKRNGCADQVTTFSQRTFRGWAFAGSLVFFTILIEPGVPLPLGVGIDAGTGAWWKPDIHESGVQKLDYNHYVYEIEYKGCKAKNKADTDYVREIETDESNSNANQKEEATEKDFESIKAKKLRELKKLHDEGILTEEEFKKEKEKILEGN